jgi:DNA topoisomerase-1
MKNYYIREKKGSNFIYTNANGKPLKDKKVLDEIHKIYIAPAYRDVKIYLKSDLLATGVDEAGRTQYIYSSKFKMKREQKKFCQLTKISEKIEVLNNQISRDLDSVKYTKEKLCALVVKIMNVCNFRGGNKSNEKLYKHHGITTLHKKHIEFGRGSAIIDFIGKKGVQNVCEIKNPEMISLLKDLYKRSTKNDPYLFHIKDESGTELSVNLADVNEYLAPYDITSKDLRTWNANIIFLKNLYNVCGLYNMMVKKLKERNRSSEKKLLTIRKKIVRSAIEKTAHALHNTPSICKSSYLLKSMISNFETYGHYLTDLEKEKFSEKNTNYRYEKYFSSILKDHGNYQKIKCNKCTKNT